MNFQPYLIKEFNFKKNMDWKIDVNFFLPLAIQVATRTIGFDIESVGPSEKEKIEEYIKKSNERIDKMEKLENLWN